MSVDKEYRLSVAIILILWVSTIVSSFVDNIPLTTMMVKVITSLSQNHDLELPLQPLIYALAFGGCLGGKKKNMFIGKIYIFKIHYIFRKWNTDCCFV